MSRTVTSPTAVDWLREWWRQQQELAAGQLETFKPSVAAELLSDLLQHNRFELPNPGSGDTRRRFQSLTLLGELDLTLGRLAEAHFDARAILEEIAPTTGFADINAIWAVWASESPDSPVIATPQTADQWTLSGRKAWCSGAGVATHALVTAATRDGGRLFAIDLGRAGVRVDGDSWPAAALSGTDTRSVEFSNCIAMQVGPAGAYLDRPGFWYGAAGVAAVWLGGAVGVARKLIDAAPHRPLGEIDLAHLGAVVAALEAGHAVLDAMADFIDNQPNLGGTEDQPAAVRALSVRAVIEQAATAVIDRVGRALGPGPLAMDGPHARRVNDLQLYLRQSHADRDLADLGRRTLAPTAG